MTNTTLELERQIEQMVAAHVAALRKAAQVAVERAFEAASAAPTVAPSRPRAARVASKRRAGAELSALGERFFETLSRRPGETMVVLSAEVGASPQELHRAVGRLREAGRVKTVGERSAMRYFPVAAGASS